MPPQDIWQNSIASFTSLTLAVAFIIRLFRLLISCFNAATVCPNLRPTECFRCCVCTTCPYYCDNVKCDCFDTDILNATLSRFVLSTGRFRSVHKLLGAKLISNFLTFTLVVLLTLYVPMTSQLGMIWGANKGPYLLNQAKYQFAENKVSHSVCSCHWKSHSMCSAY